MARKRKKTTSKSVRYYAKSRRLSELSALNRAKLKNTGFAVIGGIAAKFIDNSLNFDPKIKGAALIGASLIMPDEYEPIGYAMAGKGGELLAQSLGILSDKELDGIALISEQELNELADEISDELNNELAELSETELALAKGEENLADIINDYAI